MSPRPAATSAARRRASQESTHHPFEIASVGRILSADRSAHPSAAAGNHRRLAAHIAMTGVRKLCRSGWRAGVRRNPPGERHQGKGGVCRRRACQARLPTLERASTPRATIDRQRPSRQTLRRKFSVCWTKHARKRSPPAVDRASGAGRAGRRGRARAVPAVFPRAAGPLRASHPLVDALLGEAGK
jgi:hypothetical protein